MHIKHIVLLAALLTTSSAFAVISIEYTFTPTLTSGTDPYNFAGSTWTFSFTTSQQYYSGSVDTAYVSADTAFLTISGANDYNGIHSIEVPSWKTVVLLANSSIGDMIFGLDSIFSTLSVPFDDVTEFPRLNFFSTADSPLGVTQPNGGGLVSAAHFDGATFKSGSEIFVDYSDLDTGVFSIAGTTISATGVVPEPSQTAVLFGISAMGLVFLRRRYRA